MSMFALILTSSLAFAGEFLIFPLNAREAVTASGFGGALISSFDLFGTNDYSSMVLAEARPLVQARFDAKHVPTTVDLVYFSVPPGTVCYAGAGAPLSVTKVAWPAGDYYALYVATAGVTAWIGDVLGETRKQTLQGFRESGVDAAICPLR